MHDPRTVEQYVKGTGFLWGGEYFPGVGHIKAEYVNRRHIVLQAFQACFINIGRVHFRALEGHGDCARPSHSLRRRSDEHPFSFKPSVHAGFPARWVPSSNVVSSPGGKAGFCCIRFHDGVQGGLCALEHFAQFMF